MGAIARRTDMPPAQYTRTRPTDKQRAEVRLALTEEYAAGAANASTEGTAGAARDRLFGWLNEVASRN